MPIVVRPIKHDKFTHEIIAGHNRVITEKLAGFRTINCDVRELNDIEF